MEQDEEQRSGAERPRDNIATATTTVSAEAWAAVVLVMMTPLGCS